jgi:hypothetical protein
MILKTPPVVMGRSIKERVSPVGREYVQAGKDAAMAHALTIPMKYAATEWSARKGKNAVVERAMTLPTITVAMEK